MAFGAAGGRVRGSGSEGGRHVARGLDRLTQALSACPARQGLEEASREPHRAKRDHRGSEAVSVRATLAALPGDIPLLIAGVEVCRRPRGLRGDRPARDDGSRMRLDLEGAEVSAVLPGNVFRRVLFWLPYMGVSDCVNLVAEPARRGAGVDVRPAVRSAFCEASRRTGDRRGCRGGVGGARHAGAQVRVGSHAGAAAGVGVALRRVAVRLQLGTRTRSSGVVNARPR
jgi:hypothetical protein